MSKFLTYQQLTACLAGRSLPAAFVDMEAFDANVREVLRRAQGRNIRVATKSIRCVSLLQRILQSDPSFVGLMAFSPWEAVQLSKTGFKDILLGYPFTDVSALRAIGEEVKAGKQITLMADSVRHLDLASEVASELGITFSICIDLDLSSDFGSLRFGVYRSRLMTAAQAAEFVQLVRKQPGLHLAGIMGYEAQLSGVPDRSPAAGIKNLVIRQMKRRSRKEVSAKWAAVQQLIPDWNQLAFVNGGGTGSLEFTTTLPQVTEVTAGSAFFAPPLFDHYDTFHHQPAAGFALEVTRIPKDGYVTCSGGGYIASGPPSLEKLPTPWMPAGLSLLPHEGAGEVQTPLRNKGDVKLEMGAPIAFRHAKSGEFCERFPRLLLLRNGKVEDEVKTFRGEGWCFF